MHVSVGMSAARCALLLLQLQLLGHLQEGVDGGVLVALLRLQHRADHLLVQVGKHVLKSLQVLLAARWALAPHSRHAAWYGHGDHTLVIDSWHPLRYHIGSETAAIVCVCVCVSYLQ